MDLHSLNPVFQDSLTFLGLSLGDPPWHFLQTHNWVPKVASFDALGQLLTGIKAVWSSKYQAAVINKLFPPLIIARKQDRIGKQTFFPPEKRNDLANLMKNETKEVQWQGSVLDSEITKA